jgi:hypothetical protein
VKWLAVFAVALTLASLPGAAAAQSPEDNDEGFILRVNGDVVIGEDERVAAVIVIDGNLRVEGTVTDFVLVIEGDALVSGTIEGNLTVISGDIELTSNAVVEDINSVRGDLIRAQGATVTGEIHERDNFEFLWAVAGVFSLLFWVGMTVTMAVAALLFAHFGARQLSGAATLMTGDLVNSIIGTVFLWVGGPILAVLAFITVIGIPLGLGILLFLLPAMGFLGYIVAGTRLGTLVLSAGGRERSGKPYLEAVLGVVLLQLLILVPLFGAIVVLLAAIWGAGSLAFVIYRGAGGKGFEPAESTTAAPAPTTGGAA